VDGSGNPADSDVDVVVTTYEPSGESFTLTLDRAFTYVAEPEFQIYQPLVPNRGRYDGGEPVSMSGTGIRQQVEVTFVHIDSGNEFPAIVSSVQPSSPLGSMGTITIQTPYIPEALRVDGSGDPVDSNIDVVVTTYEPPGESFTLTLPLAYTYFVDIPGNIDWPPLQVHQPLEPNEGLFDGGEIVTLNGRAIREPVGVEFILGGFTYPAIIRDVTMSDPADSIGQIVVETPFISGIDTSEITEADVKVWVGAYTESEAIAEDPDSVVTLPGAFTFLPEPAWPPLQVYQPLQPNEGFFTTPTTVTISGRAIREPAGVEFTVGGFTFPGIIQSVTTSIPAGATGEIVVETPYVSGIDITQNQTADVKVWVGAYLESEAEPDAVVDLPGAFTFLPDPIPPEPTWRLLTPSLYIVVPDHGAAAGGESVTIMGRNFRAELIDVDGTTILQTAPAVESVTFGGVEAIVQSVSPDGTQIQVITPRYSTTALEEDTPVDVVVNTAYAEVSDVYAVSKTEAYVFLADEPTPEITAIAPTGGPIDGGTQLTIFGHGFQSPAQVAIGNLECIGVQVNDDRTLADEDTIVCVTPDYSQQAVVPPVGVEVIVTNVLSGKQSNAVTFTYGSTLYISGNTPVEGNRGTNVIIYGAGFESPLTVDFLCSDACGAEFRFDVMSVSGTEILARVPFDAPIVCETADAEFLITLLETNTSIQGGDFRYLGSTPNIYNIQPTFLDPDGGGEMTITGEFFAEDLYVQFGDYRLQSNTVETISDTEVSINPIPSAELVGLVWDTSPCVDNNGLPGVRVIPTPIDVIVSNMPGDCQQIIVGGVVYEPEDTSCFTGLIANPTFLSFGTVEIGNFDDESVTITNPGGIDVNMTAATDDPSFSVTPAFTILSPDESVNLTVRFAPVEGTVVPPSTSALVTGNLNIGANASGISAVLTQVALTGTAHAEPEIVTNPFGQGDLWTFPTTPVNTCSPIDATSELIISNTGNATLTLASVLTNGPFTIASAPNATINPGESTTAIVQFCPVVDDNALQSGELIISSNDTVQPIITIDLEGQEQP
jgi:hypothetical protein